MRGAEIPPPSGMAWVTAAGGYGGRGSGFKVYATHVVRLSAKGTPEQTSLCGLPIHPYAESGPRLYHAPDGDVYVGGWLCVRYYLGRRQAEEVAARVAPGKTLRFSAW